MVVELAWICVSSPDAIIAWILEGEFNMDVKIGDDDSGLGDLEDDA